MLFKHIPSEESTPVPALTASSEETEARVEAEPTYSLPLDKAQTKLLEKARRASEARSSASEWSVRLFWLWMLALSFSICLISFPPYLFLVLTVLGVGTLLLGYTASRWQEVFVRSFLRMETKAAVGPLAEVLGSRDRNLRAAAESALIRLLPSLQASDAHLLNPFQRESLHHALTDNNVALVLAILKALEQVGDNAAIPWVEDLATEMYPRSAAVQEEAILCLEYLNTRSEQQREALSLLRASSADTASPETLLRPAHGATTTETEQLLRSSTLP